MKIAFLTSEYPHTKTGDSGGIGTSIKNLALGLVRQGCNVRVLVYGQNEENVFYDNGICIQKIKNVKFKGFSGYLTRKKLQNIINTLYRDNEIDLVEVPDWTGISSFISPKKCPLIIKLNGSDTYFCHLDSRPVKWINRFHEKRAIRKANGALSVSQFTADLTNTVFGLNRKFTIIPNGIDTDSFSNNNANTMSNSTILYFGSLIRKKGLLELPLIFNKVIQKNPNARLVLVGKDVPDIISGNCSTWSMMQSLFTVEALGNVDYLGSVPYTEVKEKIGQATLCVFPTFAEALPVSWLEAMAMGKPVVASNIGWAKEIIIDTKNGFLVDPNDHNLFGEKISLLLENDELRIKIGKAARSRINTVFDIEVVAKKNLDFYKEIINKSTNCK